MSRERPRSRSESTNNGGLDFDRGRLSMSLRTAWLIGSGVFAIAAGVAGMHYRLGSIENGISDVQQVQAEDREAAQTKAAAYVQCLEAERSNKGWRCPIAPPLVGDIKPRRTAAAKQKTKQPSLLDWPFGFSTTATAKPK